MSKTTAIQVFQFDGSPITFSNGDSVMVNATQMAKAFGKKPVDWMKNQQSQDYIGALSEVRNLTSADLVRVIRGGNPNNQGTWMHEDVALEFARWLSPEFAIWCNDRIKELLTQGVATVANDDEAILHAMQVLQKRVEESKQRLQMVEDERDKYLEEVKELTPKAQYTDEVLQSTSTYTFTQIAKDLGMRSVYALTKLLHDKGIIYKLSKQSKQWLPTAKYAEKGYFTTRTYKFIKGNENEVGTTMTTVITEKGRQFLHVTLRQLI